jgi:hypothetical protein
MPSSNGIKNPEARPYGFFQLAGKYLRYYFTAGNGKGHGIHSPFVFDFIQLVLNGRLDEEAPKKIEGLRCRLLKDETLISVEDFGAGSSKVNGHHRKVRSIAASSLKSEKYAGLLFKIVRHYKPDRILELGTSLGLTTAYLAAANPNGRVFTIEGSRDVSSAAAGHLEELGIKNVKLIAGTFEDKLDDVLQESGTLDLVFIDGNHRYQPTLDYFNRIKPRLAPYSLIIFDDIHWSREMERAWEAICMDPEVSLTIDLFFPGIAVINPDIKSKQHFSIRY